MRRDPGAEAARWLAQAQEEYKDAANLTAAGRFYLSLYLCQQSAEKALKAFLYSKGEDVVFTHSVASLLEIASRIDPDFAALKPAKKLDQYYIATRYPNGLPGEVPALFYDDPEEASKALEWSRQIIELVAKKSSRSNKD